jgi:hypothetical protein
VRANAAASWTLDLKEDRFWMTCACGAVLVRVVAFS